MEYLKLQPELKLAACMHLYALYICNSYMYLITMQVIVNQIKLILYNVALLLVLCNININICCGPLYCGYMVIAVEFSWSIGCDFKCSTFSFIKSKNTGKTHGH